MQNKILEFTRLYWHHFLFGLFSFAACSFLIFQEGIWLYNDLSWWPKNSAENFILLKQLLFSWDNFSSSAYGFDHFSISFQKLISTIYLFILNTLLSPDVAQIFFYTALFLIAYSFSLKLLRYLGLPNYKIAALFFCFNPVSIFLIAQGTVMVAYCAIPAFLYSLAKLSQEIKISSLLINIISFAALSTYLRILGLVLFFLALLAILYFDYLLKIIRAQKINILFLSAMYLICFVGLLSSAFLIFTDGISSQANYITHQTTLYSDHFFNFFRSGEFLDFISLNQVNANFTKDFFFFNKLLTIALTVVLFYFVFARAHSEYFRLQISITVIFLVTSLLFLTGKFLPQTIFIFIFTKVFFFLSSNLMWLKIILVLCFSTLIAIQRKKILNGLVLFLVCFSLLPILLWPLKPQLQKVVMTSPFYASEVSNFPSLFYPSNLNIYNSIKLSQFPYPIDPTYNSSFHYLFSNNSRLVDEGQIHVYQNLSPRPWLLWLFGLKDVFVFKTVDKFIEGQFDWYAKSDYEQWAEYYRDSFLSKELFIVEEEDFYSRLRLADSEEYDFLIYIPEILVFATSTESFPELTAPDRPLVFLSSQISAYTDSFLELARALKQNAHAEIKYSYIDNTRYYLKISGVDGQLPLVIHLNQTFNPRWKIYFLDENYWNSKTCINPLIEYSITQNHSCEYNYLVKDYFNLSFIDKNLTQVSTTHLRGNIIGNTFLIDEKVLGEFADAEGNAYLLIYFEKQDYYVLSLLAFFGTLLVLSAFLLVGKARRYSGMKNLSSSGSPKVLS